MILQPFFFQLKIKKKIGKNILERNVSAKEYPAVNPIEILRAEGECNFP